MLQLRFIDISHSGIKSINLAQCQYLQKVVTDDTQKVITCENVVVNVMLPLTAPNKVYDTGNYYQQKIVSLGDYLANKFDGIELDFISNRLKRVQCIDERNLIHCQYLNLRNSSIQTLDTQPLCALRMLIISGTNIEMLDTSPMNNLEYLFA